MKSGSYNHSRSPRYLTLGALLSSIQNFGRTWPPAGDQHCLSLWSDAAYVRMPDYAWGIRGKRGELSYELKNDAFQARLVKSKL